MNPRITHIICIVLLIPMLWISFSEVITGAAELRPVAADRCCAGCSSSTCDCVSCGQVGSAESAPGCSLMQADCAPGGTLFALSLQKEIVRGPLAEVIGAPVRAVPYVAAPRAPLSAADPARVFRPPLA